MAVFKNRVEVYIPSEFEKEIETTQKIFNRLFGGSTTVDALGGWNGKKGVEVEKVKIIYSYASTIDNDIRDVMIRLARTLQVVCKQEAVTLVINDVMYLIDNNTNLMDDVLTV